MIPENIRKINRPKNTIVSKTSKEGVYLVRDRKGYKNGKPVNGKVVGHIIDNTYIPNEENKSPKRISLREISYKYYGKVAFADSVGEEILEQLKTVYDEKDARQIYCIALLRTAFGDIKDYQLEDRYLKSFASEFYPNVHLSKNTVCKLISELGTDYKGIHDFMMNRLKNEVEKETKILIDGMLKENTSTVNTFSGFSYKGRIKGISDISIIYAVDAKTREPLCMKVYKGNLPDFSNYSDFLDEFKISDGLIIGDKGFPFDNKNETFKDGKVGYIRPIKRNSKSVERLDLYSRFDLVNTTEGRILGSKDKEVSKDGETRYYYCFQDIRKKAKEENDYIKRAEKKNDFDIRKYREKQKRFGTVTFVSNMDLKIENVYEYYKLRWEIELVFKSYKSVLSQTTTREHDDFSVNGSEFINYLSTIMTIRMQNRIEENKDKIKMTYAEIDQRLQDIIKASIDSNGGIWCTCTMSKEEAEIMKILEL
jgi:hypothetical protein